MTPTETIVAEAFQGMLDAPVVTPESDFFDLGGDSYVAVNLALFLERRLQIELPVELIEEASTVAEMASWIDLRLAAK